MITVKYVVPLGEPPVQFGWQMGLLLSPLHATVEIRSGQPRCQLACRSRANSRVRPCAGQQLELVNFSQRQTLFHRFSDRSRWCVNHSMLYITIHNVITVYTYILVVHWPS